MRFQKRQIKTVPGDLEIVSLIRMKAYLMETSTDQNEVISDLIAAAIQYIESGLDFYIDTSSLIHQYYDAFPSDGKLLIFHRYITGTSLVVEYWNGTAWVVFNSTNYRLDLSTVPPSIFLKSDKDWPSDKSTDSTATVRIGFKIDVAHSFLDDIKAAVMAWVANRYENKENSDKIPLGVIAVIDRHKLHT